MKKTLLPFLFCLLIKTTTAQTVQLVNNGTKTSIRALSVVNDNTVWVSGSAGTVGKSIDGGTTWTFITVPGFEKKEFRDIEAFDDMTAVVMSIDTPAYILRTIDGGKKWDVVFKDTTTGMFLDAMEFWNVQSGIVIGDPINGKFFIARTFDGGKNWQKIPEANKPIANVGEACFASSGTNIRRLNKQEAVFVSGGLTSSIFIRDKKIKTPIIQGQESTGANSIAVKDKNTFMVVGGDFNLKDSSNQNFAFTSDAGANWVSSIEPPHGYRSCVEFIKDKTWITCGLNGVDITNDNGQHFTSISNTGFHVCRKAKKGNAVFFAGGNGRIGKLNF